MVAGDDLGSAIVVGGVDAERLAGEVERPS